MKILLMIGLICSAFALAACSTNYAGGFKGETEVHTFQDDSSAGSKDLTDDDVTALVTPDKNGGAILEFTDASEIGECKLKLDSLGEYPKYIEGQTCEVEFNGSKETFGVNGISFKYGSNTETMFITVQGFNIASYSGGNRHFFQINFKGKTYDKK